MSDGLNQCFSNSGACPPRCHERAVREGTLGILSLFTQTEQQKTLLHYVVSDYFVICFDNQIRADAINSTVKKDLNMGGVQ